MKRGGGRVWQLDQPLSNDTAVGTVSQLFLNQPEQPWICRPSVIILIRSRAGAWSSPSSVAIAATPGVDSSIKALSTTPALSATRNLRSVHGALRMAQPITNLTQGSTTRTI